MKAQSRNALKSLVPLILSKLHRPSSDAKEPDGHTFELFESGDNRYAILDLLHSLSDYIINCNLPNSNHQQVLGLCEIVWTMYA